MRKSSCDLATCTTPCCTTGAGRSGSAELQLVLHLHLGDVGIRALREGRGDGELPSVSLSDEM